MRFLIAVLLPFMLATPAFAQSNDMSAVMSQMEQLQRQMDTIARQVYKGDPPAAAVSKPVLAGNVDVANLAAATDERLNGLEASVRQLNNRLDEQDYALGQLQKQFELFKGDTEMRFKEINPKPEPKIEAYGGTPSEAAPAVDAAIAAEPTLGKDNAPDTGAVQELPTENSAALYDAAFQALREQKYDRAEAGFKEFLKRYANDTLAGNAQYWLGETYYVRGNYADAAKIFAQGYQKYPKSSKAPDNLLKLGLSLSQSGKKQDACVTFQQLGSQYSNAAAVIKQRADEESKKLNCGLPTNG